MQHVPLQDGGSQVPRHRPRDLLRDPGGPASRTPSHQGAGGPQQDKVSRDGDAAIINLKPIKFRSVKGFCGLFLWKTQIFCVDMFGC